jgi:hypothetical protein
MSTNHDPNHVSFGEPAAPVCGSSPSGVCDAKATRIPLPRTQTDPLSAMPILIQIGK